MAAETGDDQIVPILEDPGNGEWLIDIMMGRNPESRPKPRIQKVAKTPREIKSNETCFDPLVVSLGPYYNGKKCLMPMEHSKEVTARWFISLEADNKPADTVTAIIKAKTIYHKFVTEVTSKSSPTECYCNTFLEEIQFKEFMRMMFLDGCFILHLVHLHVVKESNDLAKSSPLNPPLILRDVFLLEPLILRDMFLLENQIPYSILKALMSLAPNSFKGDEIQQFIKAVILPQHDPPQPSNYFAHAINFFSEVFLKEREPTGGGLKSTVEIEGSEPLHLLDFLQSELIGKGSSSTSGRGYCHYYFRSIMELKAAGIKLRKSNSTYLKDIKFQSGIIHGHLELPQLIVDDATKTRLLNLIAYEMCPDGLSDHTVTSYICFLDSLIDHAEDVKELRSKNILLNRLGSDEEVANLFNELANNLTPDSETYGDVMKAIEMHCKSHAKVWIAEFMHTYFTSPLTVLALMAGFFAIGLSVVQTIYSVASYYK